MSGFDDKRILADLFAAAVTAADPAAGIAHNLPPVPLGRTIVVAIGKASVPMARAFEAAWRQPLEGLVVTRHGSAGRLARLQVVETCHPVPDAASLAAGERVASLVSGLAADDLVVALVSGGGSALVTLPAPPLTLADKQAVNRALLASGMPIQGMNCIRKHLSRLKGGRLALLARPARVVSYVISDIPGDEVALVASGPTIADQRGLAEARALVRLYDLQLPTAASALLADDRSAAPLPSDPAFDRSIVHLVASNRLSLEAAATLGKRQGLTPSILSDAVEGESREVAKVHAAMAREVAANDRPFRKPALILSGGETTVTVGNPGGKGGRNSEFLLSLAISIDGVPGITALAADTDGIDGSEQNAGAFADGTTVSRLRAKGLDPRALLKANNAYLAFDALGDLFAPGPTGTNVNDFRAIVVR